MRFFSPSIKKNNAQVRETLPNTSLSVWTAGPSHEWDSMQAWLGGGQGEPPHVVGCGDCRSTSRSNHGGWRWPGIRTGLTLPCFRYSINLSTPGNHRGRVEKEPVWVQQNFTRQFQQDAAAYISNLPPAEQREFQTGAWKVNGTQENSQTVSCEESHEHYGKKYCKIKVKENIILRTQKKNKPQKWIYCRNQKQFRKLPFPFWYRKI